MIKVICIFFAIYVILSLTILCVVAYNWSKFKNKNSRICEYCAHYKNINIILDNISEGLGRCNLADESGESRIFVHDCDKCENFQQKSNP